LFEMDQIVLGNLPNDKRNAKNFASGPYGHIVMGYLPSIGWYIVMGYRPV
jgi:hypothetical protein